MTRKSGDLLRGGSLLEFGAALLLNRGRLDRDHLAFELSDFRSQRTVTTNEKGGRPEHNDGDACRNLIVRALGVLSTRDLRGSMAATTRHFG
jgi:hypothetical protein